MTGIEYLLLGAAALVIAAAITIVYRRYVVIPEKEGIADLRARPPVESSVAEIRSGLQNLSRSLDAMDRTADKTKKAMKGFAHGGRKK